jgi:hypothetical protein
MLTVLEKKQIFLVFEWFAKLEHCTQKRKYLFYIKQSSIVDHSKTGQTVSKKWPFKYRVIRILNGHYISLFDLQI